MACCRMPWWTSHPSPPPTREGSPQNLGACREFLWHGVQPCPAGEDCRWPIRWEQLAQHYLSEYDSPETVRRMIHSTRLSDFFEYVRPLDTPITPQGSLTGILWELHGSYGKEMEHQRLLRKRHAEQGWQMEEGCYCAGCYCPLTRQIVCWLDEEAGVSGDLPF